MVGLERGTEVDPEDLKMNGWDDYGTTRRNRRMFIRKEGNTTKYLLLNPDNRIFFSKDFEAF